MTAHSSTFLSSGFQAVRPESFGAFCRLQDGEYTRLPETPPVCAQNVVRGYETAITSLAGAQVERNWSVILDRFRMGNVLPYAMELLERPQMSGSCGRSHVLHALAPQFTIERTRPDALMFHDRKAFIPPDMVTINNRRRGRDAAVDSISAHRHPNRRVILA